MHSKHCDSFWIRGSPLTTRRWSASSASFTRNRVRMSDLTLDLTELRRVWEARRVAMREILERIDPRGLTRPARDADEREWLAGRDESGFIEDEAAGAAARAYYERKYRRP